MLQNNKTGIELWCFSPLFSLKLHQLAHCTAMFFMLPWHLSYSGGTLWYIWPKKEEKKKFIFTDVKLSWDATLCFENEAIKGDPHALSLIYLLFYWATGNCKELVLQGLTLESSWVWRWCEGNSIRGRWSIPFSSDSSANNQTCITFMSYNLNKAW